MAPFINTFARRLVRCVVALVLPALLASGALAHHSAALFYSSRVKWPASTSAIRTQSWNCL